MPYNTPQFTFKMPKLQSLPPATLGMGQWSPPATPGMGQWSRPAAPNPSQWMMPTAPSPRQWAGAAPMVRPQKKQMMYPWQYASQPNLPNQ